MIGFITIIIIIRNGEEEGTFLHPPFFFQLLLIIAVVVSVVIILWRGRPEECRVLTKAQHETFFFLLFNCNTFLLLLRSRRLLMYPFLCVVPHGKHLVRFIMYSVRTGLCINFAPSRPRT